jgi:uncharacterized membrane protein YoaK (UPF0700 family)
MPIDYARSLTASQRTRRENVHLGAGLAFVAGATNAGAFLAVSQYTSHVTGMISSMADAVVLREPQVFLVGLGAVVCFMTGAATTAVLVHFARRQGWSSAFALPLLLEAILLLAFGLMGAWLDHVHAVFVPATVAILCYMMGLQNAVITKISRNEIRTTHMTGNVTDLGIEFGKLFFVNRAPRASALDQAPVLADRARIRVLSLLIAAFFVGGVLGAIGFRRIGYSTTIPIAIILFALSAVPIFDDMRDAVVS